MSKWLVLSKTLDSILVKKLKKLNKINCGGKALKLNPTMFPVIYCPAK
jgi:hypothetical protein